MATTMSDLPEDMVKEILSRVSLTSLRALRCTCKTWNALSKVHVFGKPDAGSTFLGFTVIDSKLCSMKLDLQGTRNDGDLIYCPSIRILKKANICKVFYGDGLLLCVIKDERRLVVWNPYLRQTRWIHPMDKLYLGDMYGLGYENNNGNHKILRLLDVTKCSKLGPVSEIYDFNSNSWRVLDVNPGCNIRSGVSLKGNTYFLAKEAISFKKFDSKYHFFLLCFDFTAKSFGQRLVLPFCACVRFSETVILSRVRDEKLAVLHHGRGVHVMDIWITTKIETNAASWSRLLSVEMRQFNFVAQSFFIDEEKKPALVSGFYEVFRTNYKSFYIIEEHGKIKRVNIGKARESRNKLVLSSYAPSLVQLQINGRGKRKERDYQLST